MHSTFVSRDEAWLRRGVEEKPETRLGGALGGDGRVERGQMRVRFAGVGERFGVFGGAGGVGRERGEPTLGGVGEARVRVDVAT